MDTYICSNHTKTSAGMMSVLGQGYAGEEGKEKTGRGLHMRQIQKTLRLGKAA